MNDSSFKHFNPMALRDKYSSGKVNNHSNFWFNSGSKKNSGKQSRTDATAGGAGLGNISLFLVSGLKTLLVYTVRNQIDKKSIEIESQFTSDKVSLRIFKNLIQ